MTQVYILSPDQMVLARHCLKEGSDYGWSLCGKNYKYEGIFMADFLFWLYLTNSVLLINHEIDSAYWKEWELFRLPGGIAGFLLIHFPLLFLILYGLILVPRHSFFRSKGAYAGISLDGSVVKVNGDWNRAYYGKDVRPVDILVKKDVSNPKSAKLREALFKAAQATK